MSEQEVRRVAPNLNMMLWRPVIADPQMYSMRDLDLWVTLRHVMDANEALDLKAAMGERAAEPNH